jgi:hypothetical protein
MRNWLALVSAAALLVFAGLTAGCDLLSKSPGSYAPVVDVPAPDDVTLSDSLRAVYRTDAGRLALRRVRDQGGEAARQVRLPDSLVQPFYNALLQVHAADDLDGRDTVVDTLGIHTFPVFSVHEISVTPEEPLPDWITAWKEGRRFTGNATVDALLREYDLQLVAYNVYEYSETEAARLRSEPPLNAPALADRFEPVEGVQYASPGSALGDGNDIEGTLGDGFVKLRYSVGFGDCPSGCIGRHYWTFRVFEDGRVTFQGESGDPLPEAQ